MTAAEYMPGTVAQMVSMLGAPSRASLPLYTYVVLRGMATLDRGDDKPLKKFPKQTTDAAAYAVCKRHHKMACAMARAAGRPEPEGVFM